MCVCFLCIPYRIRTNQNGIKIKKLFRKRAFFQFYILSVFVLTRFFYIHSFNILFIYIFLCWFHFLCETFYFVFSNIFACGAESIIFVLPKKLEKNHTYIFVCIIVFRFISYARSVSQLSKCLPPLISFALSLCLTSFSINGFFFQFPNFLYKKSVPISPISLVRRPVIAKHQPSLPLLNRHPRSLSP